MVSRDVRIGLVPQRGGVAESGDKKGMVVGARTQRGSIVTLFPGASEPCVSFPPARHRLGGNAPKLQQAALRSIYSSACLDTLEILPGVKMREVFSFCDWKDR